MLPACQKWSFTRAEVVSIASMITSQPAIVTEAPAGSVGKPAKGVVRVIVVSSADEIVTPLSKAPAVFAICAPGAPALRSGSTHA